MCRIRFTIPMAASVLVCALPVAGDAQYRLPIDEERPTVHLEVAKPLFEDGTNFGMATAMLDATIVVPLQSGPTLFARIGFTRATLDGFEASSLISNPRVGVLFGGDGATHGELHVDLPLANEIGDDDYATGVAVAMDPERLARFNPDGWAVGATITPETQLASGGTLGARIGAEAWIPTESGPDAELVAIYSGFGRASVGEAFVDAELSGIAILSAGDLNLGERTLLLGTLTVGLPAAGIAPELFVRFPLDEDTRDFSVNATFGLRVRLGG